MIYKLSTLIFVSISYHFSCKLVILASILRFGSTLIFISVKYPKISYVTAEFSRPIVNEKNISRSKRNWCNSYYILLTLVIIVVIVILRF